jgi:hypothetical protein
MKMTLLIVQSSLVLLLISLSTYISHSETFKPIPEEVHNEICDFYDETSFECELIPSMLVWIDLDLDGEMEILIDGKDILAFQGPDGYSTWLFYKREDKFLLLNHFRGYEIKVLSNKTSGYFDLSQNYKDNKEPNEEEMRFRLNKRVYKFDKVKGKYILSGEN